VAENRTNEMPTEWNGKVPTQIFIDESLRILKAASEAMVALKMLGGLAIKVHSLYEESSHFGWEGPLSQVKSTAT
jgi:hypothetical protein